MTDQTTTPYGPAEWTPDHYRGNGLQPFDVINAFGLDFYEGNAIKYLLRWRKKNGPEDLRKALTYVRLLIERAERQVDESLTTDAPALREQLYKAMKAKYLDNALDLGQHSPRQQIEALTDAALLAVLPHGKFLGDQLRSSETTIARVITAIEAGPPSGSAITGEWESGWDAAMDAVRNTLNPTKEK